jgi:3-phenylpropionate/trans-cinnamate dioxygenase ferredoxin subunit
MFRRDSVAWAFGMTSVFVASIKDNELEEGKMKAVRLKGKPILLVRVSGEVYGVSNFCPHQGCSFQGGILTGYTLMCPCHGWKFDVRNGQYQEIPQVKLECYRCKAENGRILVEIQKK